MRVWLAMAAAGVLALLLPAGCGRARVKTHPVEGKVVLQNGDVGMLQGSHVELLKQEGDVERRASGTIAADGSYVLKTMHEGDFVVGVPEGEYQARIILGDPSDENVPKRRGSPVHPRFFSFDSSGLKVTVPSEDYTLAVSAK